MPCKKILRRETQIEKGGLAPSNADVRYLWRQGNRHTQRNRHGKPPPPPSATSGARAKIGGGGGGGGDGGSRGGVTLGDASGVRLVNSLIRQRHRRTHAQRERQRKQMPPERAPPKRPSSGSAWLRQGERALARAHVPVTRVTQ